MTDLETDRTRDYRLINDWWRERTSAVGTRGRPPTSLDLEESMNIMCPRCKQQPRPTVHSMYCRPCERAYRAEHRPETCAKHKRYREKNKGGSRVNTQPTRRSPINASIYSLRRYDKWIYKVRQPRKVDEKARQQI